MKTYFESDDSEISHSKEVRRKMKRRNRKRIDRKYKEQIKEEITIEREQTKMNYKVLITVDISTDNCLILDHSQRSIEREVRSSLIDLFDSHKVRKIVDDDYDFDVCVDMVED